MPIPPTPEPSQTSDFHEPQNPELTVPQKIQTPIIIARYQNWNPNSKNSNNKSKKTTNCWSNCWTKKWMRGNRTTRLSISRTRGFLVCRIPLRIRKISCKRSWIKITGRIVKGKKWWRTLSWRIIKILVLVFYLGYKD